MGLDKAAFKPLNAYLLMADLETDENWEVLHESQTLENWVRKEIGSGKIGYDPALTPISKFPFPPPFPCPSHVFLAGLLTRTVVYETFAKAGNLVSVKENLVDLSSDDQKPGPPLSQTWVLKQEFTGLNSGDKIAYLRGKMKENQCDCYVVTALDEIAWILNSNQPNPTPAPK